VLSLMQVFGDEIGLLWLEKNAGAAAFVQGYMNPWVHNPGVQSVDEDEKELERIDRSDASLDAQQARIDAQRKKNRDDRQRVLARIKAKPEAAARFEATGEFDRCLQPKCEKAIERALSTDAQGVLRAADMQAIPALRALFADAGLKLVKVTGRGEGVRMELLLPREQIDNLPPQPSRAGLVRALADSMERFRAQCPDRSRIVAEVKAAVARVLARFGLAGADQQSPECPPSLREIAAAHFVFSPLQPAAP
jgi:hypothetical protein